MDNYTSYIEVNPKIMFGKAVIKGTRITVELIVEKLAAGESIETILERLSFFKQESDFCRFTICC